MKGKRPRSVTFLAAGVLIITAFSWVRLVQAVKWWAFLSDLPLNVPPLYIAVTGLAFGLAGSLVCRGLWLGRPWAPKATRSYALAAALFYWFDRLLLTETMSEPNNWPFALTATIVLLLFVFMILRRGRARSFFME